jgi:hypothetical protein
MRVAAHGRARTRQAARVLDEDLMRRAAAYHAAGHAVVAAGLGYEVYQTTSARPAPVACSFATTRLRSKPGMVATDHSASMSLDTGRLSRSIALNEGLRHRGGLLGRSSDHDYAARVGRLLECVARRALFREGSAPGDACGRRVQQGADASGNENEGDHDSSPSR